MLKEIKCSLFKKQSINFHEGLNIILGDDDAKNSIGKSSALMVIDFAHGGDSLLEDKSGAIRVMGHHRYDFSFVFDNKRHYFSRSTDVSGVVDICDATYEKASEISVDDFRKMLKDFYKLDQCESSFRFLVSPFSRIWGKGSIDSDHPFVASIKESAGVAVGRLVDLFGHSVTVAAEKKALEAQRERKKLISSSMNANIIPGINKTKYKENAVTIESNSQQIENLKRDFTGALTAYEALFDEQLKALQLKKNELSLSRNEVQNKIRRLEREISGITPRLVANISLVAEFFPNVNIEKLEQVETFHHKIGGIVKKQLKDELVVALEQNTSIENEILFLDKSIQGALASKGTPDDLFARMFEIKEKTDRAVLENGFFDQKKNLDDATKLSVQRLDVIYSSIFLDIEVKLNSRLKSFNRVVYGAQRNSSEIRIKSANSYLFSSPDDTGTGKSFAGVIGFDLAVLSLTYLPFIIHDSVIYKNIEIAAIKRILRIISSVKAKQIFLSFDEAQKFGAHVENLIKRLTVLRLSHDDLLYTEDWRETK
ncbi:MAG: DUF2326 domain-containing protein [Aquabacterium sp.]|nr:DUF2326 domain-containing protein [Aquabacterium sp.]